MKVEKSVLMDYKIFIFLIGILFMFTTLSSAYDLRDYYPLSQGNTWTYSIIEDEERYEEAVKIEGKEIINNIETKKMVYSENAYECVNLDSEGLKIYKSFDEDKYEIFEPPEIIFSNNIKIGGTKGYSINSARYNLNGAKIGEIKETGQVSLQSIGDIEVPAGKFSNCLKFSIISEKKDAAGDCDKDDCFVWLAPGVGRVKEFCIKTEYDAETQKEDTFTEIVELVSAVVDGKRIGSQE